jgi:hypothetical protein
MAGPQKIADVDPVAVSKLPNLDSDALDRVADDSFWPKVGGIR